MKSQSELFGSPVAPRLPSPRALRYVRRVGRDEAEACADKAERDSGFSTAAAGSFVVDWLKKYGATAGEILTDEAKKAGHLPHEDRAFGSVFQSLARKGVIECVGFCARVKGHGTAGGRIWAINE